MTAYPAWTPASRPGIVPLHPLSFGTILGRSFVALRQNPRVLLGFALVVQTLAYVVVLVIVGLISVAALSRLDTLRPGTEEYDTVFAGSMGLIIVASFVLGLMAGALSVIVQGVVIVEVTRAVVAEKLTLRAIWRQVKPAAWRLIGYSALVMVAVLVVVGIVAAAVALIAAIAGPFAILLGVLFALAAVPLYWWLVIKLLLVPSAIIIERARIGRAIARSWHLTRGRFWPYLGVIFLIVVIFGAVGQVLSLPFGFLTMGLTTIISPTGEPDAGAVIGLLVSTFALYAFLFVIQSIALVVQSTATGLVYVDARMRKEGLDLDLLEYVERRDAGEQGLPDPYLAHIGRDLSGRFAAPVYAPAPAQQGYPQGFSQGYVHPAAPQPTPPQPPTAPPAAPQPPTAAPAPTEWAAPGTADREPPRP